MSSIRAFFTGWLSGSLVTIPSMVALDFAEFCADTSEVMSAMSRIAGNRFMESAEGRPSFEPRGSRAQQSSFYRAGAGEPRCKIGENWVFRNGNQLERVPPLQSFAIIQLTGNARKICWLLQLRGNVLSPKELLDSLPTAAAHMIIGC